MKDSLYQFEEESSENVFRSLNNVQGNIYRTKSCVTG